MPLMPVNAPIPKLPGALAKAVITNYGVTPPEDIPCMFIPKQYSFKKSNSWEETTAPGSNAPKVHFGGGKAITFSLDLFFDTYETGEDVRVKYTDKIWNLMKINEKTVEENYKGNPPLCRFSWGKMLSFQAVITEINQTFTMFLGDGTPVRATLKVDFLQAEEIDKFGKQNPTTLSVPGYKTRRVRQGETIDWIAYEEYSDSSLWRFVADVNDLEDPLRLAAGQVLAIPPKP